MTVSIITIVNKEDVFRGFKESLEGQNFKGFELIPVMNMNGEFKGAGEALNSGAAKATGDLLIFCHPDIRFRSPSALSDIVTQSLKLDGVTGVAGAKETVPGKREIVTTIVQGERKESVGRPASAPEEVQTLDECMIAVKRDAFARFTEREGWHLYGAEYCLDAGRRGDKCFAIPSEIWHLSDGKSLDASYVTMLGELIEKFAELDYIYTTVKAWKCKGSGIYRKYYYFKQKVKKML